MRANIFQDTEVGRDYIYNLEIYFTVLRITPKGRTRLHTHGPYRSLKRKKFVRLNSELFLLQGIRWIILEIKLFVNIKIWDMMPLI
jgi:hypothetical protein